MVEFLTDNGHEGLHDLTGLGEFEPGFEEQNLVEALDDG